MIAKKQKEYLINKSAEDAFRKDDPKLIFSSYQKRSVNTILSQPLAQPFRVDKNDVFNAGKVGLFLSDLYIDSELAKTSVFELKSFNNQSYRILSTKAQRLMHKLGWLNESLLKESERQLVKSEWSFTDPIVNTDNVLTSYNTYFDFQSRQISLSLTEQAVNFTPEYAFPETISFDNKGVIKEFIYSIEGGLSNKLYLHHQGLPIIVKVYKYSQGWVEVFNQLVEGSTVLETLIQSDKIKITVQLSAGTIPININFKLQKVSLVKYQPNGYWISKPITPKTAFSSIKVEPELPGVKWSYKINNGAFNVLDTGWNALSSYTKQLIPVNLDTLESVGTHYYSQKLPYVPSDIYEALLWVGEDQWEISTVKRTPFDLGELDYIPNPDVFVGMTPTCWTSPGTGQIYTDTSFEFQLVKPDLVNTYGPTKSPIITSSTPELPYSALSILAKGASVGPLRVNHIYRFKTNLYLLESTAIEDLTLWFVQGFKEVGAKSFGEENFSYGSFAFYVNGQLVSSSARPQTIFEDSTSEDWGNEGVSLNFNLEKGWNEICIYIYCPENPTLFQPSAASDVPYLQLTLYPNFLDSVYKTNKKVLRVSASKSFKPQPEFDLAWSLPKRLTNWGWRSTVPDRAAFNSNTADVIDGFIGGVNFSPNLAIEAAFHTTAAQKFNNSDTITLRADLVTDNPLVSPIIKQNWTLMVK